MFGWIKEETMLWRGAYVARTRAILDAAALVGDAVTEAAEISAGRGVGDDEDVPETPESLADAEWGKWVAGCGLDERDIAWVMAAREAWLTDKGEFGEPPMNTEDELTAFKVPREAWG